MQLGKHSGYSHARCAAVVFAVAILFVMSAGSAFASRPLEKVIHNFTGAPDGQGPAASLVADHAGNLYGTTQRGGNGSCNCGTVFELSAPSVAGGAWTETLLYSFNGGKTDGSVPQGGLLFDSAGDLYGTTSQGGYHNLGTVFELAPPATVGGDWTETALFLFRGGRSGFFPGPDLVFDDAGNLYGTTIWGGSGDTNGVVFELVPPATTGGAWTQRVVYSFNNTFGPWHLIAGHPDPARITFYGTSYWGADTIFQLVRENGNWIYTTIHDFSSGDLHNPSALTMGGAGSLYAVAISGGDTANCPSGCGGVVQLSPPTTSGDPWGANTLYAFRGRTDGATPSGKLLFDNAGNIYGTATAGGIEYSKYGNNGTVFELTPPAAAGEAWTEITLHKFGGSHYNDGAAPLGGLTVVQGKFCGTTSKGGSKGDGTVFSVVIAP